MKTYDSVDITLVAFDVTRINPGNILSDIELELSFTDSKNILEKDIFIYQLKLPVVQGFPA